MNLRQVVAISGRSGAGKTTVSRTLEDLGFFVVDNLPSQLLPDLVSLVELAPQKVQKVAFVIDAREQFFLEDLPQIWESMSGQTYMKALLFLDASDDILIDRFQTTRRKHPLDDGCGVREALRRERVLLMPLEQAASQIIDTSNFNVHELVAAIKKRFGNEGQEGMLITLLSFGFKYGVPHELDLCFDARFIENPYFDPMLRPLSGLDKPVFERILQSERAQVFLTQVQSMMTALLPFYRAEGKSYLTIAIGCTGGRHRSPALVRALAKSTKALGAMRVLHRDVEL